MEAKHRSLRAFSWLLESPVGFQELCRDGDRRAWELGQEIQPSHLFSCSRDVTLSPELICSQRSKTINRFFNRILMLEALTAFRPP